MHCQLKRQHLIITGASVVEWSEFLATDPEALIRFPALQDCLRSNGSGTGSTPPRQLGGVTWKKNYRFLGSSLEIRDNGRSRQPRWQRDTPRLSAKSGINFADKAAVAQSV
jgi:hypothetical protein